MGQGRRRIDLLGFLDVVPCAHDSSAPASARGPHSPRSLTQRRIPEKRRPPHEFRLPSSCRRLARSGSAQGNRRIVGTKSRPRSSAASRCRSRSPSANSRRSPGSRLRITARPRSEEHTSELQSLMRISYAVFCLKKKNTNKQPTQRIQDEDYKYTHN